MVGMETHSSVSAVSGRSKEKKRAQTILENTTRSTNECYEVGFFWADESPTLLNNYYCTHQQSLSINKRLGEDRELKKAYKATIEKGLENHFVRKLEH